MDGWNFAKFPFLVRSNRSRPLSLSLTVSKSEEFPLRKAVREMVGEPDRWMDGWSNEIRHGFLVRSAVSFCFMDPTLDRVLRVLRCQFARGKNFLSGRL